MNKKALIVIIVAVVLLGGVIGFSLLGGVTDVQTSSEESVASLSIAEEQPAETVVSGAAAETAITLSGDSVRVDGGGATVSGSVITITQAGTYTLSGTLTDGQILVDADSEAEVHLVLSGVDITCSQGAPINIRQAACTYIETVSGTENVIADTENYVFDVGEDEPDAAIYSKDDLVLDGEGSLTVTGNYAMAIHGKDAVTVAGGALDLTSVGDGLKGKDSVTISGGAVTIDAGEDGIQASNDTDEGMGNVTISGGSVTITAGKHGVKAETLLAVLGGDVALTTQEDGLHSTWAVQLGQESGENRAEIDNSFTLTIDAQQDGVQAGSELNVWGGTIDILTYGGAANAPEHTEAFGFRGWFDTGDASSDEDSASAKGLKSDGSLTLGGGAIHIDAMDDALHCAGVLTVSDGVTLTIATGDDAMHSDDTLNITGGAIDITRSYEGLEAMFIEISGGDISLVASDDGLNAAGGTSADMDFAFTGPMGGAAETLEDATYYLHITGGRLTVDAGGDGLDSNGAMFIDGGEIYVSGPTDSGNGSMDYTTTGQINGGILVAAGASGMAQNFDSSSTQAAFLYTFTANIEAGSQVTLTDSEGNVLVDTAMAKSFNCVVISTPDLTVGETYTLTCGTQTAEVTLTDTITSIGGGMGNMGGMGDMGGRGGMGAMMPGDAGAAMPGGTDAPPANG